MVQCADGNYFCESTRGIDTSVVSSLTPEEFVMKRRNFGAALSALVVGSCARMDQRQARYDPKECPFCTPEAGECFYCKGSGKCSFCEGTGTRKTVSIAVPERGLSKAQYEEECPYCKGSGSCRYCDGVGECWPCKGTGTIEDWSFYHRDKQKKADERVADAAAPNKTTPEDKGSEKKTK